MNENPHCNDQSAARAGRDRLGRDELENHLWAAADELRGAIDSSDYKHFILGLLFLKRLSDRFDEEQAAARAQGRADTGTVEHGFFVPSEAHWRHIAGATRNLGHTLNQASVALEAHNPALCGVLASIDYDDARKLGDKKQRDVILGALIRRLSGLDLRNGNLSEPDMLGRAYEYLIERFADDAGKKGGEFYTPHSVVALMVELIEPKQGMSICDPTCGSGGMLIQSARHAVDRAGHAGPPALFGQEKNPGTWAICKMNMLLHGLGHARIEKGDTIRAPALVKKGALMRFDRVIANPPFSLDNWGHDMAAGDVFERFAFGVPPRSRGDLAFVQHMVASLRPRGRMAVVLPHGALFRAGREAAIRRGLIEHDLVDAVIGLPGNLFYGTAMPAAIVLVRRARPSARKGKVLFVDGSREFAAGGNQHVLRPDDIARVVKTVRGFVDVDCYARVVGAAEIAKSGHSLHVSRYVDAPAQQEAVDVRAAVARLRALEAEQKQAREAMHARLRALGIE